MTYDELKQREAEKQQRKPQRHVEDDLQMDCVRWFDYQYPQYSQLLFHPRNGGKMAGGSREGARWKAMGVRKGVADLFLSVPRHQRVAKYGLYIELKTATGRQSDEQKEFEKTVKALDYEYSVVRNFEDFRKLIQNYINS